MRSKAGDLARRPIGSAVGVNGEAAHSAGRGSPTSKALLLGAAVDDVMTVGGTRPRDALSERLAALAQLSLTDLRHEWRRLFRSEPPRLSRDLTTRAIAYRLQEIAHGGLARATQRRMTALAEKFEVDGTITAPASAPHQVRLAADSGMARPNPYG